MKKPTGFTLIEILVVVGIIGILAALVYSSFGEARQSARNTAMKSTLSEMQLALELYKAQNGEYPDAQDAASCDATGGGAVFARTSVCAPGAGPYIKDFREFYVSLPYPDGEPPFSRNASCDIEYAVDQAGNAWYKLTAENCFEGASAQAEGVQPDDEFARCPASCATCYGVAYNASDADFYNSLAVYSAGGECY